MNKQLFLLCLLITGCATNQPPFLVEGTEQTVSVNWVNSPNGTTGALQEAENHCAKYGKHAQFAGKVREFEIAYNCN